MAPLNQAPISDNAKKETIKAIAAKPVHYKELTGVAGKTNRREHKTTPAAQTNVMSPLPQTNTEKVALATIKELPHESPGLMNAQEATLPYAQINKNQEHEKTFWEKLPIDELKKKEMKHLSEQAAAAYREINTVGKDTDEKALTIKIEKRKLVLSF